MLVGYAKAKPFLKWAGGKTQLLEQLLSYLPASLKAGAIHRYVEPFVGSGAVFFYIAQHYPVDHCVISDTNPALIATYLTIQQQVERLIVRLTEVEHTYHQLERAAQREFFYATRAAFNHSCVQVEQPQPDVQRAAQFIFLNRTCYNGLFRVNAKGGFNVPFGSYKNPQICFAENLRAVAGVLQNVEIQCGDFTLCRSVVDQDTLVYFDPPYKPISQTASFTAYQQGDFGDDAQIRLAQFYRDLDRVGAKLMLSNSDPQNRDPHDDFFQTLFAGFHIHKVLAARMISSKGDTRGKITELLITNYAPS